MDLTPSALAAILRAVSSPGSRTHYLHCALLWAQVEGRNIISALAIFFLCAWLFGALFCVSARAQIFEEIYSFPPFTGYNPAGGLTLGTDGNFYGTTFSGGPGGSGTVFKVTPGGVLSTLASFNGGPAGAHPRGTMVQDSAGNLYGIASSGGSNFCGTVFKVTLAGALTPLWQFTNFAGANPYGGLITGADGNFYGTTETYGTIFRITPTGVFTTLSTYFGQNGYSLNGTLTQGTDGNLYGAAGLNAFGQQGGIVFACPTNGSTQGAVQFGVTNGDQPYGGLVQAGDGKLYGTTTGGGLYGDGTIFSFSSTTGVFKKLVDFNGPNGAFPFAPLMLGADGNIYGSTVGGGSSGQGTLFMISTNGGFSSFFSFAGTNGSGPDGQLLEEGGIFYGTTRTGGAGGEGTVFGVTSDGTMTMSTSFPPDTGALPNGNLIQDANGEIYGTTGGGGANGFGSIFEMSPNGTVTSLASLPIASEGSSPTGPLLLATDGSFYGLAEYSGMSNWGSVFQLTSGGVFNTLFVFSYTNGANPFGGLIQYGNGAFYGTTINGGTGYGTIFNFTNGGPLVTLADFSGTNGAMPQGVTQATDGNFYGVTYSGGTSNLGTVFQYLTNGMLNSLASFTGTNGANPGGRLIQANDGSFYGTTSAGGASGDGTVFKVTMDGTLTTLASFAGTNGAEPLGPLLQASDENFYGTTEQGGDNNLGTIFEMTPDGTLTVLYSFTGAEGSNPIGGLLQGADGYLYGTTFNGGSAETGIIFRIYQSPFLQITQAPTQVLLSWPASASANGFLLESNPDITTTNWTMVSDLPGTNGIQLVLPEPIGASNLFYRLRKP